MNAMHTDARPAAADKQAVDERLGFLFRGSLSQGRIHPLYLPLLKYRQAQPGSPG